MATDITDALYAAEPQWTVAHDAEVLRKRAQISGTRSTGARSGTMPHAHA